MPRPTVSVVVPTYNRADLLRSALDSLTRQTYRDFETIVVDDGSEEDIVDAVSDHAVRPRVVRQARGGPAAARNHGVAVASADLIAFLDSDDEWLDSKLETFLNAMDSNRDVRVWYGPMQPIDRDGRIVEGRTKPCHSARITRQLFHSSFVHVPTVLCRRDVFQDYGGFDPSLPVCEDYDLWLRMSVDLEFGLVPTPLALRRLHPNRLSKSCMRRNLAIKADVLERFYRNPAARGKLDDVHARHRIARVLLAAARAALKDLHLHSALVLLDRAREYGATWSQIVAVAALARSLSCVGLDRSEPPQDRRIFDGHWPVQPRLRVEQRDVA